MITKPQPQGFCPDPNHTEPAILNKMSAAPAYTLDNLPPIMLGGAVFSTQYNASPDALPIRELLLHAYEQGLRGIDTSPYYGNSEVLLGRELGALFDEGKIRREDLFISTKAGRIAMNEFNYSREWIQQSIERSMERLHTDYIDILFCHDIEFVTPEEWMTALEVLYEYKAKGKLRYIGVAGYPLDTLIKCAAMARERFGAPLDAILSYSHLNLQNSELEHRMDEIRALGVHTVLSGSPLSMGLLRAEGPPEWHPAGPEIRKAIASTLDWLDQAHPDDKLPDHAIRYCFRAGNRIGAATTILGCSSFDELSTAINLYSQFEASLKDQAEHERQTSVENKIRDIFDTHSVKDANWA